MHVVPSKPSEIVDVTFDVPTSAVVGVNVPWDVYVPFKLLRINVDGTEPFNFHEYVMDPAGSSASVILLVKLIGFPTPVVGVGEGDGT